MNVIKETDDIGAKVERLQQLLAYCKTNKLKQAKAVEREIKAVLAGDKAERNAAYLLSEYVKGSSKNLVLHDLRLQDGDDVAQIDHLILNRFGFVSLFETKSFSTGIKVEENGSCWRWNSYKKCYDEIPSPIKQSQRHERLLKKVLANIGYQANVFRHFVIVDYKAKLIKPEGNQFANYCRPDFIEEAIMQGPSNALGEFKALSKLITGKSQKLDEVVELAKQLADMHTPIEVDIWAKHGVERVATHAVKMSEQETENDRPLTQDTELFTTSKLAKTLGLKTQDYLEQAQRAGLVYFENDKAFATEKGIEKGCQNKTGRYGPYILWPEKFTKLKAKEPAS